MSLHAAGLTAGLLIGLAAASPPIAGAAAGPLAAGAAAKPKPKPKAPRATPGPSTGATVLTATNTGPSYAPTFTGNGLLGVRVPPTGQGYAPGTVPAQSELAGFYAQPPKRRPAAGQHPDLVDADVRRRRHGRSR